MLSSLRYSLLFSLCLILVALAPAQAQERTLQRTLDLPAGGDLNLRMREADPLHRAFLRPAPWA